MPHRIRTYLLTLGLIWTAALHAQTLSDEARISLLTCAPGEELYALTANMTIGGAGNRVPELSVRHVKLEDGKVISKKAENIDYSVYGTPLESTTYKFAKCLQNT